MFRRYGGGVLSESVFVSRYLYLVLYVSRRVIWVFSSVSVTITTKCFSTHVRFTSHVLNRVLCIGFRFLCRFQSRSLFLLWRNGWRILLLGLLVSVIMNGLFTIVSHFCQLLYRFLCIRDGPSSWLSSYGYTIFYVPIAVFLSCSVIVRPFLTLIG